MILSSGVYLRIDFIVLRYYYLRKQRVADLLTLERQAQSARRNECNALTLSFCVTSSGSNTWTRLARETKLHLHGAQRIQRLLRPERKKVHLPMEQGSE
jgi:hypothetical protein